jgi:hypothetical protein
MASGNARYLFCVMEDIETLPDVIHETDFLWETAAYVASNAIAECDNGERRDDYFYLLRKMLHDIIICYRYSFYRHIGVHISDLTRRRHDLLERRDEEIVTK